MTKMEYEIIYNDAEKVKKMISDGWQYRWTETGNLTGREFVYLQRIKE